MVDRDLEREINALIPHAVREAKQKVKKHKSPTWIAPGQDGNLYQFCHESLYFHKAMDRMAKEAGLRC